MRGEEAAMDTDKLVAAITKTVAELTAARMV